MRGRGPLLTARVLATAFGLLQLAGVFFFTVLAPEEAVWLGPLVDVPVVFLVVDAVLLLLLLLARRRIGVGRDRSAARVAA